MSSRILPCGLPYFAGGLCKRCYNRKNRKENREDKGLGPNSRDNHHSSVFELLLERYPREVLRERFLPPHIRAKLDHRPRICESASLEPELEPDCEKERAREKERSA